MKVSDFLAALDDPQSLLGLMPVEKKIAIDANFSTAGLSNMSEELLRKYDAALATALEKAFNLFDKK